MQRFRTIPFALFIIVGILLIISFLPQGASDAEAPNVYFRGTIRAVESRDSLQYLSIELTDGPEKGKILDLEYGEEPIPEYARVSAGETIVVSKNLIGGRIEYHVYDVYRLAPLTWIIAIFLLLAVFFGKIRGVTSIIGMGLSFVILVKFLIPKILQGSDPLLISFVGACMIAVISLYVAHGFNKRTTIALASTFITLSMSVGIAAFFTSLTKLSGGASEDASLLHIEGLATLDLKGLFLGGIIIGALGILDDVTTGQVAVVEELHKTDRTLTWTALYSKGISVGQEHIASLINTLILAYAGSSFPLLLLFTIDKSVPLWVTINNDFLMEEIVRTLAGSTALILAVPIATALATYFFAHKAAPGRMKSF